MYQPLGHDNLRRQLRLHSGSMSLVGPDGVGRRGIVEEWSDGRSYTLVEDTEVNRFLSSVDVGDETYVFLSNHIIPSLKSRIPTYSVGFLRDSDVSSILERDFPSYYPRSLIVQFAYGSFSHISVDFESATYFPAFCQSIIDRRCPDFRKVNPLVVLSCINALCSTILGFRSFPFSDEVKSRVLFVKALEFQSVKASLSSQMRNSIAIFYGELR